MSNGLGTSLHLWKHFQTPDEGPTRQADEECHPQAERAWFLYHHSNGDAPFVLKFIFLKKKVIIIIHLIIAQLKKNHEDN